MIENYQPTVWIISRATTGGRSADPVVIDRLIGIQDGRDTLGSVDVDVLNLDGIVFDTVSLYEGNVVAVDRESEERTTRESENAQAVPLALLYVDHGEWN